MHNAGAPGDHGVPGPKGEHRIMMLTRMYNIYVLTDTYKLSRSIMTIMCLSITFVLSFRCTWRSWITWSVVVQQRITLTHVHSSHTLAVFSGQPGSQGFRGEPGSPGAKGRLRFR